MSAKAADEANYEAELSKAEKSVSVYELQYSGLDTQVSDPAAVDGCC